jgi:hypothetical protein
MDPVVLTAIATALLVVAAFAQITVSRAQRRQESLLYIDNFRQRWRDSKDDFGTVIYFAGDPDDFYQLIDHKAVVQLQTKCKETSLEGQTVWALDALRSACGTLSDMCMRILQGQLHVQDAYPAFGTELLRYSNRLRNILDPPRTETGKTFTKTSTHLQIREELQDWLIYHDGRRRRCLILVDLLWAEAARLEDLPPGDLRSAAEAKRRSGALNRSRVFFECIRLNGLLGLFLAFRLARFLRHAEFRGLLSLVGLSRRRLDRLDQIWTARLLRLKERSQNGSSTR